MAADHEVGPNSRVELGASNEVVELEAVPVLVVQDLRALACDPAAVLLVPGRHHSPAVNLEFDRGRVEGMTRQFVDRNLVFVPAKRPAEGELAIDRNRVVPEARQVEPDWLLQLRGHVGRGPDLRPLDVTQQIEPGHVVVVVVGGDRDLDAVDPEVALEGGDGLQPRPTGRAIRPFRQPRREVVAVVDEQGSAVVGQQRVGVGHARPVAQEVP